MATTFPRADPPPAGRAQLLPPPPAPAHALLCRAQLLPHRPPPMQLLTRRRSWRREVRGREVEMGGEEQADVWGPRGFHAESATTSDKTGVKTTEGYNLHWFCKLGDTSYPILPLVEKPSLVGRPISIIVPVPLKTGTKNDF
uniref:Uncharacterized protein n=1 Tax=Oryza sativa subsp. japonica TaxID=39947 RepID=Q6ES37_ORYSJ|nr:hypothetical protein [Oryza sativa Japonica Group]BAD28533.1 hypothetical protein [Oryza sativa Japonica Group]